MGAVSGFTIFSGWILFTAILGNLGGTVDGNNILRYVLTRVILNNIWELFAFKKQEIENKGKMYYDKYGRMY